MTPDDAACSPSSTPETDALFAGWYSTEGILDRARKLAEKFERESREFRIALKQIRANPGWQDPEVGFMSGHIAAGVLNQFPENADVEPPSERKTK